MWAVASASVSVCVLLVSCMCKIATACTTLVVGRKASSDGSVMLSHSNDFEANPDARLCWVPAKDHPVGAKLNVYWDKEDYRRYVGYDRGDCYIPKASERPSEPIGVIPQVKHTFAYFEAQYGVVNEHGLGIGETTCSGIFGANASGHGGTALMSVDTLSRIAMERSTSARDAVQLMGHLAEEYGFYGAGSFEGTAETLIVGDPDEAFIFHILPDPSGTSAIWAAQRVPDDNVGVVANMFVIRGVDFNDTHNFLFSESVRSVAIKKQWWSPGDGLLDFTKIYSAGEYAHKFYSGRRVWGAYRLFGIDLPDSYSDLRYEAVYPVTAKASRSFDVKELFAIHRSYYEGTKFDMTTGIAAGPWGDPDRWTTISSLPGNWERSIGIYRTSTTHVVQARRYGQGSILWFAPHASATSVFIPLAAKGTAVPKPYGIADPVTLDSTSAYWVHRIVFNVAKIKYNYTMMDVRSAQSELEEAGVLLVKTLDANRTLDVVRLNHLYARHADRVMKLFSALPMKLIAKYGDGYLNSKTNVGYPDWWLKAVGYEEGPPPPPNPPTPADIQMDSISDPADVLAKRCTMACPSTGFVACAKSCLDPHSLVV